MVISLSKKTVVVFGAVNGAIYDFKRNRIYAINHESCKFLKNFIATHHVENNEEQQYLDELYSKELIDLEYNYSKFKFEEEFDSQINFCWLEVTQSCNLKCIHCYEGIAHESKSNKLKTEEWFLVLDQLNALGCKYIQFIGGEPSCCNEIIKLLDYAGNLNFKSISYFTNGTILHDDLLKCFVRNSVRINVSLYGPSARIHDAITLTQGSFNKTVNNIHRMLDNNLSVTIAVSIMRENEEYYNDTIKFIRSIGIKNFKFDLVRSVKSCGDKFHEATRKDLIELKCRTKPHFSISEQKFQAAQRRNTCWYGKFAVSETGDVLPCVFERQIVYGNVKDKSIFEILNSYACKEFWHLDFSKVDECKQCEFRYACKDCRPLGIVAGSIKQKNPRCFYSPKKGRWIRND